MTHSPSDRDLDRLLAELPRQSASPGFAGRVLDGLEESAPRRIRHRSLLTAAAVLAAALAVAVWLLPQTAPERSLAETRALREEHRLLMEELESLKASIQESQTAPVLYLGGNEHLDLVLDLGPVWQGQPAAGTRPAVYGGSERPVVASERRTGD